ncbi:hypothetical protein GN956_G23738 [Arapaima gigas]
MRPRIKRLMCVNIPVCRQTEDPPHETGRISEEGARVCSVVYRGAVLHCKEEPESVKRQLPHLHAHVAQQNISGFKEGCRVKSSSE